MDKANLERLRQKYGSAGADDIHDPAMKKLSQALFEGPGRRKLPYGGMPTLLDAPYKEELSDQIGGSGRYPRSRHEEIEPGSVRGTRAAQIALWRHADTARCAL